MITGPIRFSRPTPFGAAGLASLLVLAGAASALAKSYATANSWVPWREVHETIQVVASRDGFRPAELKLHKSETVRMILTTADEEHCFAVDELRIEKRIVPDKETIFDLTPETSGTFVFYCCLEPDLKGRLIVTE